MFLLIPNRIRELKEEGRREARKEAFEEAFAEGFKAGLEAEPSDSAAENVERLKRLIALYDEGRITLDELSALIQDRYGGNRNSDQPSRPR